MDIIERCTCRTHGPGIDSVTFQPEMKRHNEDRMIVETWRGIGGDRNDWTFVAVLDGAHGINAI